LKLRNQRTVWESTADTRQWSLHVFHCLQNTETLLVFNWKILLISEYISHQIST
jgi:hypothetical protein